MQKKTRRANFTDNRAVCNAFIGLDWRYDAEFGGTLAKRDDEYWFRSARRRLAGHRRGRGTESIEARGLLPPDGAHGNDLLLELRDVEADAQFGEWKEAPDAPTAFARDATAHAVDAVESPYRPILHATLMDEALVGKLPGGLRSPMAAYLAGRGLRETAIGRRYREPLAKRRLRLWKLVAVAPGEFRDGAPSRRRRPGRAGARAHGQHQRRRGARRRPARARAEAAARQPVRRAAAYDHRVAFAREVCRRIDALGAEREAEERVAAPGTTALTVRKRKIVARECGKDLVAGRSAYARDTLDAEAAAGRADGAKVSLDRRDGEWRFADDEFRLWLSGTID